MEGAASMDKQDVIDRIREINISASDEFLATFDTTSLEEYLARLERVYGKDAKAVVLSGAMA